MEKKNLRLGNISPQQKEIMVEFLKRHPLLRAGKFSNSFSKINARELWQQLATLLNSSPGARKDWSQWRKTWHDLRSNVKNKKSSIIRHQRGTGGGSPLPEQGLSPLDESITEMIGQTAISGDEQVPQPTIEFYFDEIIENEENESGNTSTPQYFTVPTPQCSEPVPKQPRRGSKRVERLNHTVATSDRLAEQNQQQLSIVENYYKEKLQLMRENIAVNREISNSLTFLCSYLKDKM